MANNIKAQFLKILSERYGPIQKLNRSQSLYEIANGAARIYIRYSAVHGRGQTFFGLREQDLRQLEGHSALLCFLWDQQDEPLFVPYFEYEEVFRSTSVAGDGQYKCMVYLGAQATELYIAQAGRFNVEGKIGWHVLDNLLGSVSYETVPDLSHSQVQTLLGAIGVTKGYDIWIPPNDRPKLDWTYSSHFECRQILPLGYNTVANILQEVDVVWVQHGTNELAALFEVEHSTPIYSGLLRFNDIHLVAPKLHPRFTIVANDSRRALFTRQLNRPTFQTSGLSGLCTFLEYVDVFDWYKRLAFNKEERAHEIISSSP